MEVWVSTIAPKQTRNYFTRYRYVAYIGGAEPEIDAKKTVFLEITYR